MILTSNLQGRFSLDEQDQDSNDPLLLLAQGILEERRRRKIDLYLDLGNSFYPGPLSKFSSGSVVMDFFNTLSCDGTLVSSMDMQIGADTLESIGKGKKTKLLSASLFRDETPLFDPYMICSNGNAPIAILGVSSTKIRFDIAEKHLYNVKVQTQTDAIEPFLKEIQGKGARHIIVLSGLSLKDTITLLEAHKQIGMAICGGDNTGELYGGQASRIEMSDGRPIVLLTASDGYYLLDLLVDSRISIKSLKKQKVDMEHRVQSDRPYTRGYLDFSRRLSLWKKKFKEEEDRVLVLTEGREYVVDDTKLAFLLRDRFNAEISVVERNTINRSIYTGEVKRSDVSNAVCQDYDIFIYTITGEDLKKILGKDETLIVNGPDMGRIQGYPIENGRKYRVASTQSSFEVIEQLLGKDVPFKNSWVNVTDLLLSDLTGKKVIFKDDYTYLDQRFRTTVDCSLSNFFDYADIHTGQDVETPPGWPLVTYKKWGLENKIDIIVYNRYHQIILTPYMVYQRQDDTYQENLLRGTLLYNLNIHDVVKPYHKSQVETVLEEESAGWRPVRIRETFGAYLIKNVFSGKLGLGFEKQVNDPVEDLNFGAEAIANIKYPFKTYFTYAFNLDSFISVDSVRSEIENVLSVAFNRYLGISLKYKWWYFDSWGAEESYSNSQVVASLDLKMDVKLW